MIAKLVRLLSTIADKLKSNTLDKLNELSVLNWEWDEIASIRIEDTQENRKVLRVAGATRKEIKSMKKGNILDITEFGFNKCGADYYIRGLGFGKGKW